MKIDFTNAISTFLDKTATLIFGFLCCAFSIASFGQDITNFSQFYVNPYTINPSYAGIEGRGAAFLTYRKQWANIDGGPTIANFSIHAPTVVGASFGLNVTNDTRGILNTSSFQITTGYTIGSDPERFVRLGISAGAAFNGADATGLDHPELYDPNDPVFANLLVKNTYLIGNAGVSFHLKTFHFGASLPNIFAPAFVSSEAFSITEVSPFESVIVHASNRFYFGENKHVFEPYFVYRMTKGLPGQFEAAGIIHLNHVLWFGGSFKQDFGISALGGIKLNNTFAIGASYSLANSGINELNSPTYEVNLGLLFGKRNKKLPVYSFVNTEKSKVRKSTKKSASEMIAERRRQAELERKKQLAENKKNQDQAQAEARKQREEAAKKQAEEVARKQQEEAARKQVESATQKQQEEAARAQKLVAERQQQEAAKKQQQEAERKQEAERLQREELAKKEQAEAQRQREEQARREREEQAKKESEEARKREEALAQTKVPEPKQPEQFNSTIRQDSVVVKHKPRFNQLSESLEILNVRVTEHDEQDEKERISRLTLHASNPRELHGEDGHPNAERHEFAQFGKERGQLKLGNYVIAGVFEDETNARLFARGLKKLGFTADYGLTERGIWYVHIFSSDDTDAAKAEREKFRAMKIFRDAWLLTVYE